MRCQFERAERGFTLIEIIGVLAIMSILTAVIAPSAIQMITSSKGTAEDSALTAISDALRLYVQTNKIIPDKNTWAADLAKLMNTKPDKVSQNGNNGVRIYLYRNDFFATGVPLPYDQSTAVATAPAGTEPTKWNNPRIMVISNMSGGGTLNQASASLSPTIFDSIWNQTGQPPELAEGNLLKIARINLKDLFHPITLQNYDTATNAPYHVDNVSVDVNGNPLSIPKAVNSTTPSVRTMYLIDTTLVGLYAASPNPDTLDTTYTMQGSLTAPTYSYNTDVWGTSGNPGTGGAGGGGGGGGGGGAGPNGGSTTISTLTSTPGGTTTVTSPTPMATQKPGCTSTGSYGLTVTNNSTQDYLVYVGDTNSANAIPANPDKVKKGKTKSIDAQGGTGVPGCSVVLLSTDTKTAPIYLFYMPNNAVNFTFP